MAPGSYAIVSHLRPQGIVEAHRGVLAMPAQPATGSSGEEGLSTQIGHGPLQESQRELSITGIQWFQFGSTHLPML